MSEYIEVNGFGLVRYPYEILRHGRSKDKVHQFYTYLDKVVNQHARNYINHMMTWDQTIQGHAYWSEACWGMTPAEFSKSGQYILLRDMLNKMYEGEEWSPTRVKELL